jgi:hypothetical protein
MIAMSENQRAVIAHFRAHAADPGFPLAGRVDADRVIVAGHSRGGAASLITARAEPSVVGGVLLKPLDPMTTVGGENVWAGALPGKPFLLIAAGNDGDVPYPSVDFLYERRAGPMVAVTIMGSLHFFTCDARCTPEPGAFPEVQREHDWAVTNAYAVAFLKYATAGSLEQAQQLFGPAGRSTRLSPRGVLVQSDRFADAVVVDDFQDENPGRNSLDLPDAASQLVVSADEPSLMSAMNMLPPAYQPIYGRIYRRPEVMAQSNAHRLEWAQDGAAYRTELGGLDVRGRAAIVWRARLERGQVQPAQLRLSLADADGRRVTLPVALGDAGLGPRFADLTVPLDGAAEGVRLSNLVSLDVLLDGAGALLIDDLRFE